MQHVRKNAVKHSTESIFALDCLRKERMENQRGSAVNAHSRSVQHGSYIQSWMLYHQGDEMAGRGLITDKINAEIHHYMKLQSFFLLIILF